MPYAMPAEWAEQEWIWIGFPAAADLWEDDLVPAQRQVATFANVIARSGQQVRMVVRDEESAAAARQLTHPSIIFEHHPYGDIWLRDTGPLTLLGKGGRAARRFGFNGWGEKYVLKGDQKTGASLVKAGKLKDLGKADWILEGGAIDTDGTGLVVTTQQCLLNPNRNPKLSRNDIERRLERDLGFKRILWLGNGLLGDHTDGHVDNLARFYGPGRIAIPKAMDDGDPNADTYEDAAERAANFGLEVARIPSPGAMGGGKDVEPASYMNFVIANRVVVVPTYGSRQDDAAVEAIGALFPGRKTVGRPANAVLTGGGSFHCCSQHVPRA
ncbi:agmatine deiminase family protein [Alteraurantiacibacter aquimixticola]|uniref:Agmatine deiminase family protein n=1 Tax=Alteraurantiacibacter aquimixticola TaxID=2489173 RepID=A0A4T3EZL5_9SPHN|nr:agmatine deiminase family protein [Alteraurantiacibacter aquimixticola]TIX49004.1 agmatine deiminase family protein [Alteraurantiacibacter aquimixticola]